MSIFVEIDNGVIPRSEKTSINIARPANRQRGIFGVDVAVTEIA